MKQESFFQIKNKMKLKNPNQRFSAVIRYLIKKYNEAREPKNYGRN
jgi:hypothetical protein